MIAAIITILGGMLAAAGFIIERRPNAKELIDKVTPYQGWVGIVLFLWGVWQTISVILMMGWISTNLIFWLIWVIVALSNLFVGFLLGFGLISKYALSKNEEAMAKGQQIRAKLMKFQIPLGFVSIAVGLMFLLWSLGLFLFAYIAFGVVIVAYIILVLVAGKPKTVESTDESDDYGKSNDFLVNNKSKEGNNTPVQTNQAQTQPQQRQQQSAPSKNLAPGIYYEIRLSNVSCNPVGATFKVGMTVTAKKFVVDKTGTEREEMINDEIQIGMVKSGKEIYLKGYRFTKTVTALSLTLDQRPDKIGVDPHNKLPERA